MTTWSRSIFPGQSQGYPKHHDQEENSDRGDDDPHRRCRTILFLSDRAGIVKAARRILLLLGSLMSGFAFESRLRGSWSWLYLLSSSGTHGLPYCLAGCRACGNVKPGAGASACGAIGRLGTTLLRMWRNGIRCGLKLRWGNPCGFESRHPHTLRSSSLID